MKIALIGASGFVGSAILNEAISRGHHVTAIVRDVSKVAAHPQVTAVAVDAQNPQALAEVLKGHDRVISAYNPGWTTPDIYDQYLKGANAIVAAAKAANSWLLVVGGAGSLEVAPGVQLVDTPEFPAEWKQGHWRPATVSPPCVVKPPSTGALSLPRCSSNRARSAAAIGLVAIRCCSAANSLPGSPPVIWLTVC